MYLSPEDFKKLTDEINQLDLKAYPGILLAALPFLKATHETAGAPLKNLLTALISLPTKSKAAFSTLIGNIKKCQCITPPPIGVATAKSTLPNQDLITTLQQEFFAIPNLAAITQKLGQANFSAMLSAQDNIFSLYYFLLNIPCIQATPIISNPFGIMRMPSIASATPFIEKVNEALSRLSPLIVSSLTTLLMNQDTRTTNISTLILQEWTCVNSTKLINGRPAEAIWTGFTKKSEDYDLTPLKNFLTQNGITNNPLLTFLLENSHQAAMLSPFNCFKAFLTKDGGTSAWESKCHDLTIRTLASNRIKISIVFYIASTMPVSSLCGPKELMCQLKLSYELVNSSEMKIDCVNPECQITNDGRRLFTRSFYAFLQSRTETAPAKVAAAGQQTTALHEPALLATQ